MEEFSSFALFTGLIGGLSLFLYGMNVMSGALTKAAGGRLEQTLSRITSNRLMAYGFGVIVTALVQSSSASTVMVVGMVNAGMMTLAEAVNIILGANLGTTFTAWLLSLNAISSDNFFINKLKPTSFTPFLALIGVVFLMFSKSDKQKNAGGILIGFSVLMFGMNMMSNAVSPLKDVPAFTDVLTRFEIPVLGFLAGILFTMIIQSSAGTIGVVQALSLSVPITYAMAIPVVIGSEVGTCITAILSSFGANKNGKRTALMHLYFNLIKAISFMIIFYAVHAAVDFAFMGEQIGMAGIAAIHTLVNLVATPLMLPFSSLLVKLAYRTVPVDDAERAQAAQTKEIAILDERFLSNPAFALAQSRQALIEMGQMAQRAYREAAALLTDYIDELAEDVKALEARIDFYEDRLSSYLVKINAHHLSEADSHELSIQLHLVNDFERISDHALNIMETYEEMHGKDKSFSKRAKGEIGTLHAAVDEVLDMAVRSFEANDLVLATEIEPLEDVIDALHAEVKKHHMKRLRKGTCTIDLGFDFSDIGMNCERIADHCSNVAVCLLQINEDGFDTHEYLELMKSERSKDFEDKVRKYEEKYRLRGKDEQTDAAPERTYEEAAAAVREEKAAKKAKKKEKKKEKEKAKKEKKEKKDKKDPEKKKKKKERGEG